MSTTQVVEIGRNWYAVTISFREDERARLDEEAWRLAGARLRYPADGGMSARFHFNLKLEGKNAQMLRLLNLFSESGEFDSGRGRCAIFAHEGVEPEELMREAELKVADRCAEWNENWQNEALVCLRERLGRVQTLRRVQSVAGAALGEREIRVFLEKELRRRYKSDIFGATVLWRMGWPDTRPAQQTAVAAEPQLATAAS